MGSGTAAYIFLFLNRSGHIFTVVAPVSFWLEQYPSWTTYVANIIWVTCVLKIFVSELCDVIDHRRQLGLRRGTSMYLTPWNAVGWLNFSYAFVTVALWDVPLHDLGQLRKLVLDADVTEQGILCEEQAIKALIDHVVVVVKGQYIPRRVVAFSPFVVVSGIMTPFSQQPRLGLIIPTLATAGVDTTHFGVVFMLVFVTCTLMAMILVGQEMQEFADFGSATTCVFRTLVGVFYVDDSSSVGSKGL